MFEVTFLGHQGWQLSSGNTHLLLDPLLAPSFGHDPSGNGFDVYPPRQLDFSACPPIDAVLFSHEHEDHFDIPSIECLDRNIPVFLSARSSSAARRILNELGFSVQPLTPGEPFAVGDLGIWPLPQESLDGSHPGEWDALALHVCDREGHGSFFTTVDHRPHVGAFEALRRHRLRAGILAYADNEADHSAMFPWLSAPEDGNASLAAEVRTLLERVIPLPQRPEVIALCANGFATRGELAWMNRSLFHRDARAACALLAEELENRCVAPIPGETFRMVKGRRAATRPSRWIRTAPESEWPPRGAGERPASPWKPATGKLVLDPSSRDRLEGLLAELAQFLYGSSLFAALYLLGSDEIGSRRPAMALELLEGPDVERAHANGGSVWVWDTSDCRFVREQDVRPDEAFVCGIRCWASDLLAVLNVEMPAASLSLGRLSGWNAAPAKLRFDFPNLLHVFCHPLRAPDRFLSLYRGRVTDTPPRLRASVR